MKYNNNRNSIFNKYKDIASSADIKKAFLIVIHMGKEDDRFKETIQLKENLRSLLVNLVKKNESFLDLYNKCKENLARKVSYNYLQGYDRVTKILGKFCAIVWNREEKRVLMTMRDYFIENGYNKHHMVLCFDGMMIERKISSSSYNTSKSTSIELLNNVNEYIFNKTGFKVKIDEKSMEPTEDDWFKYNNGTV